MEFEEEKKDELSYSTEAEESEEQLDDESIYKEEVREQLVEDDELSPMEAAFMQGYDEAYI